MPLLVLVLIGVVLVLPLVLVPVSIVQRYRLGRRRQRARAWLASLQVLGFAASSGLLMVGAALTSVWVPAALPFSAGGLAGGVLLGLVGVALSRWDDVDGHPGFTPNRWLVLALTLLVVGRLSYGVWRAWHAWTTSGSDWVASAGVAGSLAAGALLVGYGLGFWAGVRGRIARDVRGRSVA